MLEVLWLYNVDVQIPAWINHDRRSLDRHYELLFLSERYECFKGKVSKEKKGAREAIGVQKATYLVNGNDSGMDAYERRKKKI